MQIRDTSRGFLAVVFCGLIGDILLLSTFAITDLQIVETLILVAKSEWSTGRLHVGQYAMIYRLALL